MTLNKAIKILNRYDEHWFNDPLSNKGYWIITDVKYKNEADYIKNKKEAFL